MKKRLFLSVLAASLTLFSCGKKKVEPTPEPTPEPAGPVDPSGGDEEELTPEQKEKAGALKNMIDSLITGTYDKDTQAECDEYTVKYSEEVAAENVDPQKLMAHASEIMPLISEPTADGIVDFLISVKEDDSLKDIVYIATAIGKSMLRAESKSESEYASVFEYAVNYLDEESTDLHSNLYELIDGTVGCVEVFASDKFAAVIGSLYDGEANQINLESVQGLLTQAGSALGSFAGTSENAVYLADLVFNGAVKYAEEVLEVDPETIAEIKEINVGEIVSQIYSTVGMASFGLQALAVEGSPATKLVTYINLALAGKYGELAMGLINEYMSLIGISTDKWQMGLGSLIGTVFSGMNVVSTIIETVSSDFVDEETGAFSIDLLKEGIQNCATAIKNFGAMGSSVKAFDSFLMLVVENTLVTFGGYEEDAAKEVAAKLDISEEIDSVFASITSVGKAIEGVDEKIVEIIACLYQKDYEGAVSKFLEYIGTEVTLEVLKEDFDAISGKVLGLYAYFTGEEFAEKWAAVVNEEHQVVTENLKALLVEIGDEIAKLDTVKENASTIVGNLVQVVKDALVKFGMSKEEVEGMFTEFDEQELVGSLFDGIDALSNFIKEIGSNEDYNTYFVSIAGVIEAINDPDKDETSVPYAVIDGICDSLGEYFGIESERMANLNNALKTPFIIKGLIDMIGSMSGESSLIDQIISVDEETGKMTMNESGLKKLIGIAALSCGFVSSIVETYIGSVDVIDEIISKIDGTFDPEAPADPESVASKVKEALESVKAKIDAFMKALNDEATVKPYLDMVILYGNLVLEGVYLFGKEDVEAYDIASYVVKVLSLFVDAEPKEIAITDFAAIEEKVGEAIGVEEINEAIAAGENAEFEGQGVALDVYEKDEVYFVEVTLVNEYKVVVEEGVVTSVSVEGSVYTYELPSLEDLAELFAVEETTEVVPA